VKTLRGRVIIAAVALTSALLLTVYFVNDVDATEGGGGGGGDIGSWGCTYYSYCAGGAWYWFSTTSNDFDYSGTYNTFSTRVHGCQSVGGFWIYKLVDTNNLNEYNKGGPVSPWDPSFVAEVGLSHLADHSAARYSGDKSYGMRGNWDQVHEEYNAYPGSKGNWGTSNLTWFCFPKGGAKDWSYSATSTVTSPVEYRTTLNFKHTLKNDGKSSSELGATQYWTTGKGANATKESSGALGPGATKLVENYNSYTTTASDIGQNTVCQRLRFSPKAHDNTNNGSSQQACASVYSPWTVSATTTINSNLAKPGDNISFTHKLSNNDRVVKNDNGSWAAVTGTVNGAETNAAGSLVNTTIPFAGPNTSFKFNTTTGNGESISNSVSNSFIVSADGAEVGKKYCQYVSVDKPARNNTTAASGAAACVSVPYNYTTAPIVTGAQGTSDLFQSVEAGDTMVVGQQIEVLAVIGTNPNADYKTKTPNIDVRVFCTKED
jgi:hypothetical protein